MLNKRLIAAIFLPALTLPALYAQPDFCKDRRLAGQIVASGFIHSPLPLDTEGSYEASCRGKKVFSQEQAGVEPLVITYEHKAIRAEGSPGDRDYATYGEYSAGWKLSERNLEKYNRLVFRIYPECEGTDVVNVSMSFRNGNVPDKAGYWHPSGSHFISLRNREWNECFLDIDEYQRDCVEEISFSMTDRGGVPVGAKARIVIDSLVFQQVGSPDMVCGWVPDKDRIAYSGTGYATEGTKTAVMAPGAGGRFILRNMAGRKVYSADIRQVNASIGSFGLLDFSSFRRPGRYTIEAGGIKTKPFSIGDDIWQDSWWRVLNYIFSQRCGYSVPGIHDKCHEDLMSEHDGRRIPYSGGWHDAGDLSQQTLQTGDVAFSLLEAYVRLKDRNPVLAARLLEEARWGIDFILKNRYGDGYRASSMGLLIWQDGQLGTFDDITSVRVQNMAYDNFLYSGYEAYAAMNLPRDEHARMMRKTAEEDFAFAMDKFTRDGYDKFYQMYEHTYNTSRSQYHATISWAASQLYKLTGDRKYAALASENIRYTLACQETGDIPGGLAGYFYRDTTRRSVVHFIHQSRDQIYMQALAILCETQPESQDYAQWHSAIRLYGNYLKGLMKYTWPYGMIPSGVYLDDEYVDQEGFHALHLLAPANAEELYTAQVNAGVRLDGHHFVRRFPVWFSIFNGNSAVHLSTGKAAAICASVLDDEELREIAREQLYWTVGKNPFSQSLIYGEGHDWPSMNSFSSGEITGEMPVGIRTRGNDDVPYWPHTNNACYKEVWVTTAGKWISLLSELIN